MCGRDKKKKVTAHGHYILYSMEISSKHSRSSTDTCCFILFFTVYKQDVIDLCRNRYQGSPKPTYKDKPIATATANTHNISHSAPHQNGHQSQHATKQYGRETAINGHHSDDRPSAAYASRQNPNHHATVNQRQIKTELTVSHNSAPKKQTTFSHVDSSERTELHSTSVNSGMNRRQGANASNQTSNCQASSANSTISHNATQLANCPPIPPHNVSRHGKDTTSQNASKFANCPPIPPHGSGFGHGKPTHNAARHDSSTHNASGHVYSPVFPGVPHSISGFGHGALTHNTSGRVDIQPSQNAPRHTSNPSSHNSTAYSKSLPPHQASGHGNHLSPQSQGNARRTKSEPDDDDVCQIKNDTQDGCRIRVNTEHFIYRRNAVREPKQGAGSKSPTRDNRTWREYRHHSGGQRSQSQSDDSTTTTTRAHEPIWRRKSEDLRSPPLVTGMPTKAMPHKSEDLLSPPLITSTGTRTQKSENLRAPPLVAGMLTQKSKETEINGVFIESGTQPYVDRKNEPVKQKVGSSSGHSATHSAPGHVTHNASAQAATHNASGHAASNKASGHSAIHSASGQSEVGKESQEKKNSEADRGKEEKKKWCALILLVPVRLGGDEVNPIYVNPLRSLFTLESCMGIIGGKPKHSLYYVGFQG